MRLSQQKIAATCTHLCKRNYTMKKNTSSNKAQLVRIIFPQVRYPNQTSFRLISKTSSRSHLQRPSQKPPQNLNFFSFSSQSAPSHFRPHLNPAQPSPAQTSSSCRHCFAFTSNTMVSELRNGSSMRMKNELANQYMRTFSHFGELSALLPEPLRTLSDPASCREQ